MPIIPISLSTVISTMGILSIEEKVKIIMADLIWHLKPQRSKATFLKTDH